MLQGELAHRIVKRLYSATNKRHATGQIAKRWQRMQRAQLAWQRRMLEERRLGHANLSLLLNSKSRKPPAFERIQKQGVTDEHKEREELEESDPQLRFHVPAHRRGAVNIFSTLRHNHTDPAYHKFLPKLQDHLLGRLLGRTFRADGDAHEDFTAEDRQSLRIVGNKLYSVKTCRIYYTSYDMQRDFDTINPTSHPDVMVRSPESDTGTSPFWYGRVIGIYHANIWTTHNDVPGGAEVRRMDVLWVRWFGTEPGHRSGSRMARLPMVGFVEAEDDYAFSFLDPADVVRGCHLIPAFSVGRTLQMLPVAKSAARVLDPAAVDDWVNYYVNMLVRVRVSVG